MRLFHCAVLSESVEFSKNLLAQLLNGDQNVIIVGKKFNFDWYSVHRTVVLQSKCSELTFVLLLLTYLFCWIVKRFN